MPWKFDLKACGIVTGSHTAATTAITLQTGEGARFAGSPRKLVIYEASYYDNPAEAIALSKGEIVVQTLQSGDVLTVQRARDGTTALTMTDANKIWYICNFVDVQTSADPFNVKSFGAVGDGVVDDTVAVHDAITTAGNFGSVYFPNGTYNLSTWPTAGRDYGPRTLFGETGSIIDGPATALFVDVSDELYVHDLSFTTWLRVFDFDPIGASNIDSVIIERCNFNALVRALSWVNPGSGIVSHFRIKDCLFNALTERAIWLYGVWNHMEISGCRIDTTVDGAVTLGRGVAADEGDWRNTHVIDNSIKAVSTTAANVRGIEIFGRDSVISGNTIEDVSGGTSATVGIHCLTLRAVITDNVVFDVDGSVGVLGIGIQVQGNDISGDESASPKGYNVVISNNVIDGNDTVDSRGIYLANDNIICSSNVIIGIREIGITTDTVGTRTHSNILIIGNYIDFGTVGSPGTGINIDTSGDRYHVIGNDVKGATIGIDVSPSAGTPTDYRITGNSVDAGTTGIRLNAGVVITGVVVDGNHLQRATTGISFQTTAPDNVQALWNSFRGITTNWALGVTPTNFIRAQPNSGVLEFFQDLKVASGDVILNTGVGIYTGSGVPGSGLGSQGSIYLRTGGGSGTTFYYKQDATTWSAVA